MPMHTLADRLHIACSQAKELAGEFSQNPPKLIGYRERVRIERLLFLIAKEMCLKHLGYELHGLSEAHREELTRWFDHNPCGKSLENFLREVFELRVFVLALSSTNPYVSGDALSRASLTKRGAVITLSRALYSLAEKALDEDKRDR